MYELGVIDEVSTVDLGPQTSANVISSVQELLSARRTQASVYERTEVVMAGTLDRPGDQKKLDEFVTGKRHALEEKLKIATEHFPTLNTDAIANLATIDGAEYGSRPTRLVTDWEENRQRKFGGSPFRRHMARLGISQTEVDFIKAGLLV